SPYLLQHANNPVDWYPWAPEALERAVAEQRPILLSVGYAACHWCHVMEHESFEDETTARYMNEHFVNVKVDREERPDIDGIYMQAVQTMTGHGGWPMTVFLTPDGVPFYSGTYFPSEDRHGMPSFQRVLHAVNDAWEHRRADVDRTASTMRDLYASAAAGAAAPGTVDATLLDAALDGIIRRFDPVHGGFEGAPKFPQTMALEYVLLRGLGRPATANHAEPLHVVRHSFLRMARGGLYDQIGGGFARYSVDAEWLVPHFEKMLYDNALLVRLGAHLWQATRDEEVLRVTTETVEWLVREMTSPEGGFYSSLDADSEGHEGKFYIWSEEELDALLGADSPAFKMYYGVERGGNFEGKSILFVPADRDVAAARAGIDPNALDEILVRARKILYDARARRVWPGRDEKILAAWNGLMLRGAATAARVFDRVDFEKLAIRNAEFLLSELVRDGRVMRSHKEGVTRIAGFLEDHAAVALGFLAVYELTFDDRWVARAREIADAMIEWFWDDEVGAFFDTARDAEPLITRPRDITDNATPSGTSLAVELLLHLAELEHDGEYRRRGVFVLETAGEPMMRFPIAFGHLLGSADMELYGAIEVALVGDVGSERFKALERAVAAQYVPSLVLAGGSPDSGGNVKLLADRPLLHGRPTAYVCRGYTCDRPVTEPTALAEQLDNAARAGVAVTS
ncbi:MAG: thioredoxin domain-containing protein, partial [Gemmatimonadaceae bacterium]